MEIFGSNWRNHQTTIERNWREVITESDWVLIPGDISWALRIEAAIPDLLWLHGLPGRKVIMRGNHDYWWPSQTKLKATLPESIVAFQIEPLQIDNLVVVGARGWSIPGDPFYKQEDAKLVIREVERFKMSLRAWKSGSMCDMPALAMFHFPPVLRQAVDSPFLSLLQEYQIATAIYGHLHGEGHALKPPDQISATKLILVSADYLQFKPLLLFQNS